MSVDAVVMDGSGGEGGGQILRTSLALSAVTGRPLRMENVRANRPNPGLARQHLAGLELMAEICHADVSGAVVGSTLVEFAPGKISHGHYSLDVGTAGSVTLVLQTALPALASVKGESVVELTGGTDVRWSPPLDHCSLVLFPLLRGFGLQCDIETVSRGYYPRGGGRVKATIRSEGRLSPLVLGPLSDAISVHGLVNVTRLPLHIAQRIRDSALKALPDGLRERAEIVIEHRESGPSQGAGMVLAATDGRSRMGASSLGERGKPAESVGREAALALMAELGGSGSVDLHASDQLLPYLAMAGGLYSAASLTSHAETNVRTIEAFLGKRIMIERGDTVVFSCDSP